MAQRWWLRSIDSLIDPAGYLRGWTKMWLAEHGVKAGPIFRERATRGARMLVPVNTGSIADAVSGDWFNTLIKRYAPSPHRLKPGSHQRSLIAAQRRAVAGAQGIYRRANCPDGPLMDPHGADSLS